MLRRSFFPQTTNVFDKIESKIWKRITLWTWSKQCDEYVLVQFILGLNVTNVISFVTFHKKLLSRELKQRRRRRQQERQKTS